VENTILLPIARRAMSLLNHWLLASVRLRHGVALPLTQPRQLLNALPFPHNRTYGAAVPGLPRRLYWMTGKGKAVYDRAVATRQQFDTWDIEGAKA